MTSLLNKLNNSIDSVIEQRTIEELEEIFAEDIILENKFDIADSQVTDLPEDMGLEQAFETAFLRLKAAQRSVQLVNKLKDPEQRSKNKSRVFMNMNRLKGLINTITKMIQQQLEVNTGTIQRSKFF